MLSRLRDWLRHESVGRQLTFRPYMELRAALQGHGDDPTIVERILIDLERRGRRLDRYETLCVLLSAHPRPHWANYFLCLEEAQLGIEEVRSYPTYVWMDISSICSVECRFCKYTH